MAVYEFLIATSSSADKEGTIVAITAHGWNWGRKEIDKYLIVLVEFSCTLEELQYITAPREDGVKHRYYTDLIELGKIFKAFGVSFDINKARNPKTIYQPCKTAAAVVKKFDGRKGREFLSSVSVNCEDKKTEVVLSSSVFLPLLIEKEKK